MSEDKKKTKRGQNFSQNNPRKKLKDASQEVTSDEGMNNIQNSRIIQIDQNMQMEGDISGVIHFGSSEVNFT
jgi:hypothetical protein